jgi:hypothetical protein
VNDRFFRNVLDGTDVSNGSNGSNGSNMLKTSYASNDTLELYRIQSTSHKVTERG